MAGLEQKMSMALDDLIKTGDGRKGKFKARNRQDAAPAAGKGQARAAGVKGAGKLSSPTAGSNKQQALYTRKNAPVSARTQQFDRNRGLTTAKYASAASGGHQTSRFGSAQQQHQQQQQGRHPQSRQDSTQPLALYTKKYQANNSNSKHGAINGSSKNKFEQRGSGTKSGGGTGSDDELVISFRNKNYKRHQSDAAQAPRTSVVDPTPIITRPAYSAPVAAPQHHHIVPHGQQRYTAAPADVVQPMAYQPMPVPTSSSALSPRRSYPPAPLPPQRTDYPEPYAEVVSPRDYITTGSAIVSRGAAIASSTAGSSTLSSRIAEITRQYAVSSAMETEDGQRDRLEAPSIPEPAQQARRTAPRSPTRLVQPWEVK